MKRFLIVPALVLALCTGFAFAEEQPETLAKGFLESVLDFFRGSGNTTSWEYVKSSEAEPAEAYILYILDQYGDPVPDVMVSICTDRNCTMGISDENGLVTFSGTLWDYHIRLLRVPEGYSFDPDFELSTGNSYGEWKIYVNKL